MIKVKSIRTAAFCISLTATLAMVAAGLIIRIAWCPMLLSALITFVAVYLIAYTFIRILVVQKLKPIYEIVTGKSTNLPLREFTKTLSLQDDIIKEISEELTGWEEKREEEINKLLENERFRREYLGNVSHELKTPVFTLQGYIQTLLDGALDDKEINYLYLDRAEKNIERLVNVITDLDEISKYENGESVPNMEVFNLRDLLKEVTDPLQYEAERQHVKIRVTPKGNAPIPVYADRLRIGQVFVNLISNSLKYSKPGGGTTTINFVDMFDKVMVEIQDDGIGIAKEHQWRVFERFFRVDKSRSREQGGTGLGLSIVKLILDSHNETIVLRSELGKGTTFSFSLSKPRKGKN